MKQKYLFYYFPDNFSSNYFIITDAMTFRKKRMNEFFSIKEIKHQITRKIHFPFELNRYLSLSGSI